MPNRPVPLSRIRTPNIMPISAILPMMEEEVEPAISTETNIENRDLVIRDWMLGPEKTSVDPNANAPYWQAISAAWNVSEDDARLRFCANCEYFDNTTKRQAEMLAVPNDQFDLDGGGRGYCVRFDFVCHNLRVCQAWEEKEFEEAE